MHLYAVCWIFYKSECCQPLLCQEVKNVFPFFKVGAPRWSNVNWILLIQWQTHLISINSPQEKPSNMLLFASLYQEAAESAKGCTFTRSYVTQHILSVWYSKSERASVEFVPLYSRMAWDKGRVAVSLHLSSNQNVQWLSANKG